MSKPKEFWLNGESIFMTERDGQYFQNALHIKTIHVIEKSAADKLAEALTGIIEIGKRNLDNPKYDDYFTTAYKALAEYRGEKS